MGKIEIGRLLRASTTEFVVGCRVKQLDAPSFGGLVRVPLEDGYQVFGLIHDIRVHDDGLVRQLATAEEVQANIIADSRQNRTQPIEISVLAVGYQDGEQIHHLLPPRPPLSLDVIYLCSPEELCQFTGSRRFGYFRHILRADPLPVGELLAAHLRQAQTAHTGRGDPAWANAAAQELITLLRDDYPRLMSVLSTLGDALQI